LASPSRLYTLPLQGLPTGTWGPNSTTYVWPPRPSFEIWVEASIPHNSYILYGHKMTIMGRCQGLWSV
jgi:hypothetical protein